MCVDGQRDEVAVNQGEERLQSPGRSEGGWGWVEWRFRTKPNTATGDGLDVEEHRRRNESRRGTENPDAAEPSCFLSCVCSP